MHKKIQINPRRRDILSAGTSAQFSADKFSEASRGPLIQGTSRFSAKSHFWYYRW